jgi:hypothetical protein
MLIRHASSTSESFVVFRERYESGQVWKPFRFRVFTKREEDKLAVRGRPALPSPPYRDHDAKRNRGETSSTTVLVSCL